MNEDVSKIKGRIASQLVFLTEGNVSDETIFTLLDTLLSDASQLKLERDLLHYNPDTHCHHRHLDLTKDGRYECSVCGMVFEVSIPY
jgi:hypothetical protein